MPFKALNLSAPILRGIQAAGYADPTPIQLRAIPVVLGGGDLIGSAQTGTGKTAAFALPILDRLLGAQQGTAQTHAERRNNNNNGSRRPRVLVLEPTRELAAQVETAFRDFARYTDLRTLAVFGGVGYGHQRRELARGVDIIVATPGRLMDFLNDGTLSLSGLTTLVLDEVDHMLDMGFLPAVREIIGRCPSERQTLLFSATVPPEIQAIASFALRDPARVAIGVDRNLTSCSRSSNAPISTACSSSRAPNTEPIKSRANSATPITPSPSSTPIARKTNASRHSPDSSPVNTKSWSRPTSPHAASTSQACHTLLTTTSPKSPKTTSTVSDARAAPKPSATPSPSSLPKTRKTSATSNASSARASPSSNSKAFPTAPTNPVPKKNADAAALAVGNVAQAATQTPMADTGARAAVSAVAPELPAAEAVMAAAVREAETPTAAVAPNPAVPFPRARAGKRGLLLLTLKKSVNSPIHPLASLPVMLRRIVPLFLFALAAFAPLPLHAQREKLPPEDLEWVEQNFPNAEISNTGIRYVVLEKGEGPFAKRGQTVSVLYIGRFINGDSFDQALDPKKPFKFRLGRGQVIQGWDQIIQLMRPGDKWLVIIPPELAYGTRGQSPRIPPNTTLVFTMQLLSAEK